MKQTFFFIALALLFTSCNIFDDRAETILIKGQLKASTKNEVGTKGEIADLTDSKRVMVFYGNRYSLGEITDGAFAVDAEIEGATALVFLDESNKFIGNLFTGGLNILPLNYLEDGRTVIDLENLILDGTSVIPSHNPIGDEIDITEEEVIRYREIGAYYESLAKNIDADNDGIPDILDKKELRITSHFSIFGGTWGENSTPPEPFNAADIDINYQVRIEGNIAIAPTSGSQVILSGPIDNPYNDISQNRYVAEKDCFIVFFWRQAAENEGRNLNMNLLPFQKGTYNFTLGSRYYTLNYSNIDAKYYLVIASPTFHTNSEGMVTSVTLNYILPDNTVVDPENFVTILQLQIERKSGSRIQLGSLYESVESNRTIKDITNVTIETPFPLSDIASVSVNYNDFLGNEYDVIWRKDY